ncbi:MAG: hypothetical protein U0Z44_10410 [Kouleothrix sp.]|jgi:hypothetical protein|nr:hypothetical protein [Kouleothrix sp.]
MFDIHSLDIGQLEQLRNQINRRLLQMRRTEGLRLPELLELFEEVKMNLLDQGKEWHSLERWQWMEGGIKFWLNPTEQDLYRPGWYTIDELIAWTHDTGPVMIEDLDDHGVTITWLSSSDESAVNPVDALLSRA